MAIAYYVVILLHIIACFFLIGVVLLQQGKSQDLASAFGGGGTQAAFGPRAGANVLTRATAVLAGVFMVTSLALTVLRPHEPSVLDAIPETTTPAAPAVPPVGGPVGEGQGAAPAPAGQTPAEGTAPAEAPAAAPVPAEGSTPASPEAR